MNTWPTLKEWWQFGGTLAVEPVIVFAVAKLASLRIRSAQWQRALWQMALLAMFLVVAGELNGVRNLVRLPSKPPVFVPTQRTVVVSIKEPDFSVLAPLIDFQTVPTVAPRPVRFSPWEQHSAWPAFAWLAGSALIFGRALLARMVSVALRFSCRRIEDNELNDRVTRIHRAMHGTSKRRCRDVTLLESARAVAPFTFGSWKPVIVVPRNFAAAFSPEQRDVAIAHELAHIAGFDSAWRGMGDFVCALLWWHPLVWLAKRELAHASELVADEASLLISDGPNRLAECLVACARKLRRPAFSPWLGMDGDGFRSALGQRVARLLKLQSHRDISCRVSWPVRMIAPVLCVGLLWMGMAFTKSPAPAGSWKTSILGTAWAAATPAPIRESETNATSPPPIKNLSDLPFFQRFLTGTNVTDRAPLSEASRLEIARLVQDGKLYYETGRLDAARTNLIEALRLDPTNAVAYRYLSLLDKAALETNPLKGQVTSSKRQAIFEKLRNTRLKEWGPIDNLPLSEVIRGLSDALRRLDVEHKGVNFMISGATSQPAQVDTAGLRAAPAQPEINGMIIRLGTQLKDLSVEDALTILEKIAERKIKYSIEDYGVIISARADGFGPRPLHTRYFHVDAKTFPQQINSLYGPTDDELLRSGLISSTISSNPVIEISPAQTVIPGVRTFSKSLGIDLSVSGKAIFYNDRLGLLLVRATLEDLDKIENALKPMIVETPDGLFSAPPGKTNAAASSAEATGSEVARLVQDGKLYYETGRLKEAEDSLRAALKMAPKNQGAAYFLDLVKARQQSIAARLLAAEVEQEWTAPVKKDRTSSQTQTNPSALHTRFFKVDPNTLQQGLNSMVAFSSKGGRSRLAAAKTTNSNDLVSTLQSAFKLAGVDLAAEGKNVLFNDRVGTLMVRATLADLEVVERMVQLLNISPPQLTIRVKIFEVEKTGNGSAADWFLGTLVTNDVVRTARESRPTGFGFPNSDAIPAEMLTSGLRTKARAPNLTNAAVRAPAITGILTDSQFRNVVRALEQRGNTDMLSAPEVTTMSGRQAQIKVVDVQYIVTDLDYSTNVAPAKSSPGSVSGGNSSVITPIAEPFEIGPVIDIVPYVMADGMTIQMTVLPTIREFLGYDDPGQFAATVLRGNTNSPPTLSSPTPLPRFRLRQVATTAQVWDGQTLVLSAGTSRQEMKHKDASGKAFSTFKDKELFYFITPRLIDPAGNPLHSQNDLEDTHSKGVPAQKVSQPQGRSPQ